MITRHPMRHETAIGYSSEMYAHVVYGIGGLNALYEFSEVLRVIYIAIEEVAAGIGSIPEVRFCKVLSAKWYAIQKALGIYLRTEIKVRINIRVAVSMQSDHQRNVDGLVIVGGYVQWYRTSAIVDVFDVCPCCG
ncbi:MAG: hypothetical protein QF733_08270 [Phycisphaerales bacterium]|nr:hypothetical protein [Phycisphaerales bacterium]